MPDWNVLSNLSITWTQKYNGTTYTTRTITVNYGSNNTDVKRVVFNTTGSHTYTPSFLEKKYCQLVRTMIGGGQAAGAYAGGNAARVSVSGDSQPLTSYNFTVGGPGQSTYYNYSGGALTAASGSGIGINTTYKFNDYYNGGNLTPNTLIFTKGYGGLNANGSYAGATYYGSSSNLSQTGPSSGGIVSIYRTEYSGQGGLAISQSGYTFGRGGNGTVVRAGYPVVHFKSGSAPNYYYFFVTTLTGSGSSSQQPWGNGGDAPNGLGGGGAVILTISRRLNSNGV
jgi:hypothetical protein